MRIAVLALLACGLCWGQATDECKPSTLNNPGARYPCVYPDGRATFRVVAPEAQKVQVRVGRGFDMNKGPDGAWTVTTTPLVVGFHYYSLVVDGATVADPATHTFFGSGWENSGIEIPETADVDYYFPKNVPHGQVSQRWYYSKVTEKWRRCYVYTPPNYDSGKARYPVLYLLHGWGENEVGWHLQGHADLILDNLIAAKKAKPMIIVMDNLNAVKPGEDSSIFNARGGAPARAPAPAAAGAPAAGAPGAQGARGAAPAAPARGGGLAGFTGSAFTEMMFTDLIPTIEKTYRALPGPQNRAMAGLSMGGMQTFRTTLANLDKFAYIGGFSGSSGGGPGGTFDPKTSNNGVFADAAAFNKKVKVLFLGIGSVEGPGTKNFSDALTKAGIKNVYFESPGTAHEWLTWRRCLNDFAPRLFK
jgi:enterochelin esterase family protein